jgi:hypothetical protein
MRTIIARYSVSSEWKIPKELKLLSEEENKKAKGNIPFSWWIKWDTLHYYDADGVEQELEAEYQASEHTDFKRPDEMEEEDDEEEEDEDLEKFTINDEDFLIGVTSGNIYQNTHAGDVWVGRAGKGRFEKVVKPSDYWCDDHIYLALNYGNCGLEGKHPRTTDEEWAFFCEQDNRDKSDPNFYNKEIYTKALSMLDEERMAILHKLNEEEGVTLRPI